MQMKVHSFESMAAVDGVGLRLCVFMSGCSLRCAYCHNPDTWFYGTDYTPEQIAAKASRYKPYFKASGGGVTFSGGEPLLQAEAICETAELLQKEDIGYTLDTSGCVPLTDWVKMAIDHAELVICDLKFADAESYRSYAEGELSYVLQTLAYLEITKKRTWVRTVIVPGINDTITSIDAYAEILASYPDIERWQLLGFHTMGFQKYEALGLANPLEGTPPMDADKLQQLQAYADLKIKKK